ncbi:MAG: arsenate reductase ArsC [Chloroflexota bacterium]
MVVNQNLEREFLLRREIAHLTDEFKGTFGPETVERFVRESLDDLEGVRVKDFIPIFVRRFSRDRLKALAQAEGRIAKEQPEVLFVCTHNAGRSQMAAALMQRLSGGRVHVRSAGSDPADQINPAAIEVMAEVGLDLSEEFPKPLTDEVVQAADAVITMGCGDACPVYPGKRYEDWELDDPSGQPPERVREIRDAIALRVELLLAEMGIPREPGA